MPLRDIAVALAVFGSLPYIYVSPQIGVLMWSWIAYMVPHKISWGFARDFQFAMIIAVATIFAWLVSKESKKLPINFITTLMITLAVWVSITTIFAVNSDLAFQDWERAMKILAMTFLALIIMQNRKWIEAQIWVIVCSLGFYGVKGGVFMVTGGGGRVYGPHAGLFSENNALGVVLIMLVPLVWYLQTRVKNFFGVWALRGSIALIMLAIIGTHSRGAAVGAAAMVLFLLLRSRKRALLALGLAVGVFAATPFIPSEWFDRVETIKTYEEDKSAMGRIQAWTFAIGVALDNPILGGGFEVNASRELFYKYVPDALTARTFHSSVFQMLGEHGFVGLAIYLLLGISTYLCGTGIIRRTRNQPEFYWANDLARMIQVSIIGYAVGGLFLDMAFLDLYYHLVAIMVLTKIVVAREMAEAKLNVSNQEVEAPSSLFEIARLAPAGPQPAEQGDRLARSETDLGPPPKAP